MEQFEVIEHLMREFPQQEFEGNAAPHECLECSEIRNALSGVTWAEVPTEFLDDHDDSLPLLAHEAYVLFLPAWLRRGVQDPDGPVAQMLMVNLRQQNNRLGFTKSQAWVVMQAARYIAQRSIFGEHDPVQAESLTEIERVWVPHAP